MNENEVAQNTVVDVDSNNQVLDSNNNFSEIENNTQDIGFEETNYGSVESIMTKSETLKRTFLPIIEVALIRLLGTSDAYKRKSLNVNFENNEFNGYMIIFKCPKRVFHPIEFLLDIYISNKV